MNPPRCLVLSDFNVQPLADYLRNDAAPPCDAVVGPFGQVAPVLLDLIAGRTYENIEYLFIWTQPEAVISGYKSVLAYEAVTEETILAEVAGFVELIIKTAERLKAVFVAGWTQPYFHRGLGSLSMRPEGSARLLMKMNLELCDRLARQSNVHVLNSNAWFSGNKGYSQKLWYLAKMPFSPEVFEAAARDFAAVRQAVEGRSRKLIVVDLDDTLWGGIVGEVGWENLRIGGHDAIGEAYADFQRGLKALSRAGIVLAIASKNDESVALEALERHPEMILRRADFSAWRINWSDKAANILEIAAELNLDPSSIVYIDDSPAERGRVRSALPSVAVPEWPEDVFGYSSCLAQLSYFDKASITAEDRQRTSMYVADAHRTESRNSFQSMEDWLQSLNLTVSVEELSTADLARAAQLFNKTNQMNLTTRRLSEPELWNWARTAGNRFYVFRVADNFGDYGLTGIVGLTADGSCMKIADFLLSCRVMGRGIEELMLSVAVNHARASGMTRITTEYIPTARNGPCLSFFKSASKFRCDSENRFSWQVVDSYSPPAFISVKNPSAATP
jgi:FkbH-like protein